MELNFQIETEEGHLIYGTQRYQEPHPTKVVIFVHGLTGNPNEVIHWLGADFVNKNGFAAVRFELYGCEPRARIFDQTSVRDHAVDLNRIQQFCRDEGYQQIYLVGHSLGGPVILLSDTSNVSSIVLWDPTYNTKFLVESSSKFDKALNGRVIDWGIKQFWGNKMADELLSFPDCGELISKVKVPIKIIIAENRASDHTPDKYFGYANEPKAMITIPGSTHCFTEEHAPDILFRETLSWFCKEF